MELSLNPTGLAIAAATFVGIWWGHVVVRKVEATFPALWMPILTFLAFGAASTAASLSIANDAISGALGVLSITFFWDALECVRQEKRVIKGHAPANPNNPRHAKFLQNGKATTLDLLNRDPVGRSVNHEEAIQLVSGGHS